jgi:hypothetical protein
MTACRNVRVEMGLLVSYFLDIKFPFDEEHLIMMSHHVMAKNCSIHASHSIKINVFALQQHAGHKFHGSGAIISNSNGL